MILEIYLYLFFFGKSCMFFLCDMFLHVACVCMLHVCAYHGKIPLHIFACHYVFSFPYFFHVQTR